MVLPHVQRPEELHPSPVPHWAPQAPQCAGSPPSVSMHMPIMKPPQHSSPAPWLQSAHELPHESMLGVSHEFEEAQ